MPKKMVLLQEQAYIGILKKTRYNLYFTITTIKGVFILAKSLGHIKIKTVKKKKNLSSFELLCVNIAQVCQILRILNFTFFYLNFKLRKH
jgi:hypothetical protein